MRSAAAIAFLFAATSCADGERSDTDGCPPIDATAMAGGDRWTTTDGCPASSDRVHSHAGPAECGWELVDYLVLGDRTYHWDPVNFLSYVDGRPRNRTLPVSDLPADAVDSGLRRGEEALWEVPGDPEYVYVAEGDFADRYLFDAESVIVCS